MASNFIKGEGKFIAKEGDSYSFIKKQLIHEGIKSIVSKELLVLGLNKDLFWQKYNEKLEVQNLVIETNLKEIMQINESSSAKQLGGFYKRVRKKKMSRRIRFSNMDNMLPKFAVRKISRSQKNANYRYIKMEGEVNKTLLTTTYYNLVRGKKVSDYGSLFFNVNYILNGISYSELGVDNENDFEKEVTKNWLDWFLKNKPPNIANTELLEGAKLERLESYLKLPAETLMENTPDVFVNSLLLEIEIVITKKAFNKKLQTYSFEYKGHAYLKDLQSNLNLESYKFSKTQKSYRQRAGINIANLMANHVYYMAKESFPKIKEKIKSITPINSIQRVKLSGFQNTKEIYSFLDELRVQGVKFSLKVNLESISIGQASIVLYFDGTIAEMKSFLATLQSARKAPFFEVIETHNALGIKLSKEIEKI